MDNPAQPASDQKQPWYKIWNEVLFHLQPETPQAIITEYHVSLKQAILQLVICGLFSYAFTHIPYFIRGTYPATAKNLLSLLTLEILSGIILPISIAIWCVFPHSLSTGLCNRRYSFRDLYIIVASFYSPFFFVLGLLEFIALLFWTDLLVMNLVYFCLIAVVGYLLLIINTLIYKSIYGFSTIGAFLVNVVSMILSVLVSGFCSMLLAYL
jgi:hypothetical protein